MSIYHWIMMYAAVVNCLMIWCIDCIFIKSLNFLSGRSIELTCGNSDPTTSNQYMVYTCSQTSCSSRTGVQRFINESCDLEYTGLHCEQTYNEQAATWRLKCHRGEWVQEYNCHECSLGYDGNNYRQTCETETCLQCNIYENSQTSSRNVTWQIKCSVEGQSSKCQQCCQKKESQLTKKSITISEAPMTISSQYHTSTGE